MRFLGQVSLCCLLAMGTAAAQRGGGFGGGMRGGMGGGAYGGGSAGGGVFNGGGVRGGVFNGGFNSGVGFRGGFNTFGLNTIDTRANISHPGFDVRGFRFRDFDDRFGRGLNNGFYGLGLYGGYGFWPALGYPYYWPEYAYSSYYPGYDYPYPVSGYTTYQTSPNVTVIYPAQNAVPPLSAERARPVTREYDQNGLEIQPGRLYLIAFKDHSIVAATTYRVEGNTLHYTTQQNENKDASLDTVDRPLTLQLNRERQVPFNLPPQ